MAGPLFDHPVAVRAGEHACCRFHSAEDRWRAAVAVVLDGLRENRRVIYVCDGASMDPVCERLAAVDESMREAVARGQLQLHTAGQGYAADGSFDVNRMLAWLREHYDLALADGYAGATFTGEIGPVFREPGGAQLMQEYERRLDGVRFSGSVRFCQYDHEHVDRAAMSPLTESHDVDLAPELATIGRKGALAAARVRNGWLRLAGELDFERASEIAATLDEHFDGELKLDLADLRYVDVAGMRSLRGSDPRPVRIAGASPAVDRLLELLGWDTDPEVTVVEAL